MTLALVPPSAAGAAKMIAEQGWRDAAAVASRRAGELYGLDVVDEDIQDMKDNVTRFVVLSRDPLVATDALTSTVPYKTSIVFSLQEVGLGGEEGQGEGEEVGEGDGRGTAACRQHRSPGAQLHASHSNAARQDLSAAPCPPSARLFCWQGPGMLFKALSVFALRDIDMTKIESRPMRANPLLLSGASGSSGSVADWLGGCWHSNPGLALSRSCVPFSLEAGRLSSFVLASPPAVPPRCTRAAFPLLLLQTPTAVAGSAPSTISSTSTLWAAWQTLRHRMRCAICRSASIPHALLCC